MPLQKMPCEYDLIKVQVPLLLQELRQIKGDFGKFSEDSDRYIEVFQNLTQVFVPLWKDVMVLLNQTLTMAEKQAALKVAEKSWDELCVSYSAKEG